MMSFNLFLDLSYIMNFLLSKGCLFANMKLLLRMVSYIFVLCKCSFHCVVSRIDYKTFLEWQTATRNNLLSPAVFISAVEIIELSYLRAL